MGALQSSPGEPEYVHLAKRTGFSFQQIGILHRRFKQLSHNEDTLLREHFRKIPDLESNPIRSQIIEAFFDRRNFRQNGEGTVEAIGFEEFLVIMSHFRPPSPHITEEQREAVRRDKLRCSVFRPAPYTCSPLRRPRPAAVGLIRFFFLLYPPAVLFNMHDTDNDGTITLEEYRHVVEELLSLSGALEKDTAKSIADAAMLEVASISMGHMEPDEFYEGITFEHFLKLLNGFEIESRMNIRFLNMDTTTLCK
ncbi:tescalcin b isoform 3-T3 [Spinachia spinachia]